MMVDGSDCSEDVDDGCDIPAVRNDSAEDTSGMRSAGCKDRSDEGKDEKGCWESGIESSERSCWICEDRRDGCGEVDADVEADEANATGGTEMVVTLPGGCVETTSPPSSFSAPQCPPGQHLGLPRTVTHRFPWGQ